MQVNFGDGTVTTYNHSGSLSSSNTGITVAGNTAPTFSMTAPRAGSVHTTGAAITLTASASDAQGIASVEFYDGSTLLYTDTASPWTYNWTSASEGSHTIKAKAFDTLGAWTESSTVSITVQDVESVSVSANPVAGQAALVTVYGAASGCGAVTVSYGQGEPTTYAIDGLPVSNYFTWTTGGQKTITATGQSNCSGSAQTTITVNAPPSVSLTAPANNDTFYAPATVNMTATASDSDGSVASVKFYAGSTLLHTDTSSPYSYSWSGMSNGNYSTAVTTDNQGATTTSSAASITIADPATSTVTGVSVSQSSVSVNTSVTITVTGGNPCGAVQINFNDGNAPYLPIEGLPYQTTHSWSSAGTYTITATGQGNRAGQASTQITVTSEDVVPSATSETSAASAGSTFGMAPPLAAPVTVTLDIAAGANGTATSSPSGFNCTGNDTTCTAEFEATTMVTLTATPGSGNTFLGWGGACSGMSTTCEISATSGQLVTAAFGAGSAGTITYYHTDVLRSVRAITAGNGDTVIRQDYFAFGGSGSSMEGDPRRYLGQERDAETGFDHFGARQYRNVWGRFASVDPIMKEAYAIDPQLFGRYSYARQNPLRFIDPSGLEVMVLDSNALDQIRNTLPESLRKFVQLNQNKMIDLIELLKAETDNADFLTLLHLVRSSTVLRVGSGAEAPVYTIDPQTGQEREAAIRFGQNSAGEVRGIFLAPRVGTLGPDAPDQAWSRSGQAEVWLSRKGSREQKAMTAEHEIYGHAILYFAGLGYSHERMAKFLSVLGSLVWF